MNTLRLFFAWSVGVIILIIGIFWLNSDALFGVLHILLSLLIFPVSHSLFKKIKNKKVSPYLSWLFTLSGIFLIFYNMSIGYNKINDKIKERENVADKYHAKAIEYIDKKEFDTVPYFINKAKKLYQSLSDNKAIRLEKEFNNYNDTAYIKKILVDMTDKDYQQFIKNGVLKDSMNQKTLNALFKDNVLKLSSNRDLYLKEIEQEKKRIEKIKEQKKRRKLIEEQFSAWDGSHIKLTRYIKESMNDPDSYEHVETRYKDNGSYILVIATFRGNNVYGGKVKNTISAKVDINGNVIEIIN